MAATSIVELRIDIRLLAELLKFYRSKGVNITHRSEIVRFALEDLRDLLVRNNELTPFSETIDAIQYLENCGLKNYKRDDKVRDNYLNQLQVEREIGEQVSDLSQSVIEDALKAFSKRYKKDDG